MHLMCGKCAFPITSYTNYYSHLLPLLSGPPSITEISGKTVTEGGNLTLKCLAVGKPAPSITWTRLSDNHTVTMPLIYISRYDAKDYRCTADNGVGTPAYKEISVNVQCECYNTCSYVWCINIKQYYYSMRAC